MKAPKSTAVEFNTIREILEDAASRYANHLAFKLKHKNGKQVTYENISYKRFMSDIYSFALYLKDQGFEKARIAITGINSYEWMIAYYACLFAGHIAVPIDKELQAGELKFSLVESESEIVIYGKKTGEKLAEAMVEGCENVKLKICMDEGSEDISMKACMNKGREILEVTGTDAKAMGFSPLPPNEMAVFLFTSGTTSSAKAVMLSNRNLASNIYGLSATLPQIIVPGDVNLAFLPFHHTLGITGAGFMLCNGATNVFCDGLKYLADNLAEYKVSVFVSVPLLLESMQKKILKAAEKTGKLKTLTTMMAVSDKMLKVGIDMRRKLFKSVLDQLGGSLRLAIVGAAPIDASVINFFNSLGITLIQGYGLTETSPVLAAERPWDRLPGSVGKPLVNVQLKISEPNEEGVGELLAKGPNVMLGYSREEFNRGIFKDGWFCTGDLAVIDKKGYVHIRGRQKNVIVLKNGKNVYPEELEEVIISALPEMEEVLVFGWEKDGGLLVCANLVSTKAADLSEEELAALKAKIHETIDRINGQLPPYKTIHRLLLSTEPMEKTTTSKIRRPLVIPQLQTRADYF